MRIVIAFGACVLALSGCGTTTSSWRADPLRAVRAYDGPDRPASDLARIMITSRHVVVAKVDEASSHPLTDFFESEAGPMLVAPGKHIVTVVYVYGTVVSKEQALIELDAEAGHVYTFDYQLTDQSHVTFRAVDHGIDFDAKCGKYLKMRPIPVLMGSAYPCM